MAASIIIQELSFLKAQILERPNKWIILISGIKTNVPQPLDVAVNKSFQSNYGDYFDNYQVLDNKLWRSKVLIHSENPRTCKNFKAFWACSVDLLEQFYFQCEVLIVELHCLQYLSVLTVSLISTWGKWCSNIMR